MSENTVETVESPVLSESSEADELRRQLAELQAANEKREAEPDESPAEREATGGYTRGSLAGHSLLVPPLNKWRSSAMRALNAGDFETWAEKVLDEEDYEIWLDVDPTVDEINSFFEEITGGLGADQGNSRASRRSSRPTPRR